MESLCRNIVAKPQAPPERNSSSSEFERARASSNFVRAAFIGRQLPADRAVIEELECAAIKQFLIEYQNFEGAARLITEYGFTARQFRNLIDEILAMPELASRQTFSLCAGRPAHLSLVEQIRFFAD